LLSLTIDEREVDVKEGATILEAAEAAGVYVPTFCYHKRLMPFGACRMCVVEVECMPNVCGGGRTDEGKIGSFLLYTCNQWNGGTHQYRRGEKGTKDPAGALVSSPPLRLPSV